MQTTPVSRSHARSVMTWGWLSNEFQPKGATGLQAGTNGELQRTIEAIPSIGNQACAAGISPYGCGTAKECINFAG